MISVVVAILAIVAVMLIAWQAGRAQVPFDPIVGVDGEPISVAQRSEILVDETGSLSIEDIMARDAAGEFSRIETDFEFGFTHKVYWARFDVVNSSLTPADYILNSNYPLIDSLTFYEVDDSGIRRTELGDALPYHDREIETASFSHNIHLAPMESRRVYMRIQSSSSLSVPLKLYTATGFAEYLHDHMLILGMFYGIVGGLICYNAFLYILTRESAYFSYVAFAVCNAGAASSFDGINYLLLPNAVYWQSIAIYEFICLGVVWAGRFAREYLMTAEFVPWADRVIRASEYLFIGYAILLAFIQTKWLFIAILVSMTPTILGIVISAFIRIRQGYAPAWLFAVSWISLLSAFSFGVITAIGILPLNSWLPYMHKTGVSIEMILLSMALAHRINLLKSAERTALALATQAAAEAQAKSDFLAKMSHEIRTPMNGVLGLTELLRKTELSQYQENYVDSIHTSGKALLGVINDVLDYSKMEAGRMVLESVEIDLEKLLDDCAAIFALRSCEQSIPLLITVDPAVPVAIFGDPTRLRQIIVNLLSNAYKFTETGHVKLRVSQKGETAERRMLLFEVVDTGMGISNEGLDKLFKSFAQEDSSITRKYGGTGLGLAICKQLAELMGGEIGVESEKGRGSRFWFTMAVPRISKANESVAEAARNKQCAALQNKRTLLFDPHEARARTLTQTLEDWGLKVERCASGDELQQALRPDYAPRRPFELCLIVEDSPRCASPDTLAMVKERVEEDSLPVIMAVSTRNLALRKALRADEGQPICLRVLELPLRRQKLRAELAGLSQRGEEPPVLVESAVGRVDTKLFSDLRVLVAEDNPINRMVLLGMLKRFGIVPAVVENGRKAVEACQEEERPFDLIFMDCEMPEMDGYQAARRIRELQSTSSHRTTIFALTAHAMEDHRQMALDAGMDDHLTKPISIPRLEAALGSLVDLRRSA